jgi:hypothetical protein
MSVLSNRTLPADALDLDGLFAEWQRLAHDQNEQTHDRAFLCRRLKQTLAVDTPNDVVAETEGGGIILGRASKKDRVPGIWMQGRRDGKIAVVIDPYGSAAGAHSEVVRRLLGEGRTILLPDVFQTGSAKAPRAGDAAVGPVSKPAEGGNEEEQADAAAGYGKFLTFNVSVDAARVQDILTAVAYANQTSHSVEVYARGDAAIWATFAAAVSDVPVSLHLENVPELNSNSDYIKHFNVPGILRAGGWPVAENLANSPP